MQRKNNVPEKRSESRTTNPHCIDYRRKAPPDCHRMRKERENKETGMTKPKYSEFWQNHAKGKKDQLHIVIQRRFTLFWRPGNSSKQEAASSDAPPAPILLPPNLMPSLRTTSGQGARRRHGVQNRVACRWGDSSALVPPPSAKLGTNETQRATTHCQEQGKSTWWSSHEEWPQSPKSAG